MEARDERRTRFGFWLQISSRWADCDAYGHVNNAMYYNWFDTALTTMLLERGVLGGRPGSAIGLCVESHCEFLSPIDFPATVDAGVRIGRVGNKSLRYELALFHKEAETPAAVGWFVHVFVDPQTRRPVLLTPDQKRAVGDLVTN